MQVLVEEWSVCAEVSWGAHDEDLSARKISQVRLRMEATSMIDWNAIASLAKATMQRTTAKSVTTIGKPSPFFFSLL